MNSSDPKFSFDIVDQPSDAAPGSTVTENCKHDYNTITSEDVTFSPAATNREIKEVHEEEGWIIVSSDENDAQQRASTSSNQRRKIDYEFHEYQALRDQNQDSMIENVEARQALPMNQSSYLLLGSVQTEKQNENSIKAAAALSAEPVLKEAGKSPEALLHHGLHRRSLQLEDTPYTVVSLPAQSPSNCEGPISPLETPCTPIKGKETEKVQLSYPQNRNSTANIPKPSGIGLHLNSIINVLQTGSGAVVHTKSAQTFNFSIRGKKPTPKTDSHFSDTSKTSSVFTDDSGPEIHASEAVNSVTYLPIATINSSNNPEEDGHSAQGNKRLYTNIESDGISEDIKSNPKKKRKRSDSSDGDGDGCKRCHCKKSKCLKLYCDCFAAGLYCAGSCACQACYNRPEYEDKVLESRQQIELRNPLAFAPKIVKHSIEPPASISGEDETHFTPSSARHKRGCNCKKSMCLKKYCECYHANVGCSDGCRCEGCKNVFGIKGDYSLDMDTLSNEGITEITDASFLEMMPSGNGDLCHSQLTPRTPAVHFKKDVREGSLRPRQCFQSPESGVTFATPNAMTPLSPLISDNDAMILEASQEALNASPISELYYDNVETQGELKLSNPMLDDTPDILKESPAAINAVKSSSPNKKRVSPPHVPRHEFGLRSLNGLRNGRKFILKAVPSIPPHTPSTDARRGGPQGKTGPQD